MEPEATIPLCPSGDEASPLVVLVVGPTAGHVYPALSVAEEFRRGPSPPRLLFVSGREGPAVRLLADAGQGVSIVSAAPIKRAGPTGAVRAVVATGRCFLESRRLLRVLSADLVLGFGSYVSGGVLLAARSLGIPTALHEANLIPGLANRLLKPVVTRTYLAYEEAAGFFPAGKRLVVGMPVRRGVSAAAPASREVPAGRAARIVVTSGTGGEAFLAREAPAVLAAIGGGKRIEVVHQTGTISPSDVARAYRDAGIEARVIPFIADMAEEYRRADVAIARGGAGTLAELGASALPALVVPLAGASDDHQTANARRFQAAGAGVCMPEGTWNRDDAAAWLRALLTDPDRWRRASDAARSTARLDAAARLVADCKTLLKSGRV